MKLKSCVLVLIAGVSSALAGAGSTSPELVGPENEWFGIDNLEVTYSGGTELFNVRFDRRSFNDVFGTGTPTLPFDNLSDIDAVFSAIAVLFNDLPVTQFQLRPIVRVDGGPDKVDNLFLPLDMTDDTIITVANVDDGGPTGWRYNEEF